MTALLEVRDVVRTFGARHARHIALDNVNLTIDTGVATGVVGESGSGKSTLARIVCGLDAPTSGSVLYKGVPLDKVMSTLAGRRDFRRAVQFVGQDTTSSFDPRRRLRDSIRTPLRVLLGMSGKAADAMVDETLASMEVDPALADRYPDQVSGGQRQRMALARGLIVRPRILICDEVVSALDVSVQGAVLNLLKRNLAEHNSGLVFVSHGLPATTFISDDILVMYHGKIIEHASTSEVIHSPRHPYTRSLLDAYSPGGHAETDQAKGADRVRVA